MRCVRTTIVELDKIPGIGDTLPSFEIVGVKPGFHLQEEDGQSAFEALTEGSFPDKWKPSSFIPKISPSFARQISQNSTLPATGRTRPHLDVRAACINEVAIPENKFQAIAETENNLFVLPNAAIKIHLFCQQTGSIDWNQCIPAVVVGIQFRGVCKRR